MSLSVHIHKKLSDFTLDVAFETNGDALGILGASGSGKSMTLRCIAGLDTPDSGHIILNGRTLYDSEKSINIPARERKVGMLFQNYALFPHMTVSENIAFALHAQTKENRKQKIHEMVAMTHLQGLENRYPRELSGGQQQRAALARALAVNPECLLLDEPFSALDDYLRNVMIREFAESVNSYKGSILFVTHNIDEAFRVCDNILVVAGGTVKGNGAKHDLFENPPTLEAARITGCKNISKVKRLSDHTFYAEDWGCTLSCKEKINYESGFAGIRANYLTMNKADNNENVLLCDVADVSESPFRMTVFLTPVNLEKNIEHLPIQWDISKDTWESVKDLPRPWRMYINPEKMFVIG